LNIFLKGPQYINLEDIMLHNFLPVIVGTDINAYNMSISFHEEYGIHPVLVGKEPMGFTNMSTIPQVIEYDSALGDSNAFTSILGRVAEKYKKDGRQLLLVGTNDLYVRLIIENQEKLRQWYVFNYISEDLMNNLLVKKNFYRLCDEHGLDTPDTYFYSCREQGEFNTDIRYPAIVKPSNGVEYYKNKFDGQQKVYRVETPEELLAVIDKVTASGYKEDLIIQDFIPGDDTFMWDSVFYVN